MPIPEYQKAEPSNLSKLATAKLAEGIATQLGYEPGGDLLPILEKIGGRLVVKDFWDLQDTDSGSIAVHSPNEFDIFVSSMTSGLRDRFTIAHEIGHFILHFLLPRKKGQMIEKLYATRYGSGREEWEANWFAAAFLMPEDNFRSSFNNVDGDLTAVALKFGVSIKAASVRAESLGLI